MHKISLVLACLAYLNDGNRLSIETERFQSRPFEQRQATHEGRFNPHSKSLARFLLTRNPRAAYHPCSLGPRASFSSPIRAVHAHCQTAGVSTATAGCLASAHCGAVQRLVPLMSVVAFKETTARSAVKAIGWRLTAGVVTAITSYIFTHSLAMAASIVGWDLCSKSVTMFIGERIWNKFDWGKEKGADSSKRSLAKAIAWRIFAAFNTLVGSFILTKGQGGVAGKIAGSDTIVKTVLFYFYERLWSKVSWGRIAGEEIRHDEASEASSTPSEESSTPAESPKPA